MKTVIFTDMDGTLLDHDNYSYEAARPALESLAEMQIPVVPTTSKTYAELLDLREKMGLTGPFIIENGAAIYIPHKFFLHKPSGTTWQDGFWCKTFISSKSYWLKQLDIVKLEFNGELNHFSNMDISEIQAATGLDQVAAAKAAQRQFGEPVLWFGSEQRKKQFIKAMTERGANVMEGGRFIHISGDCNKATALTWFMEEYQRQHGEATQAVALGDGKNDIAMLEAADIAIRIRSDHHHPPEINKSDNVFTSTLPGPAGWQEMVTQLILDTQTEM